MENGFQGKKTPARPKHSSLNDLPLLQLPLAAFEADGLAALGLPLGLSSVVLLDR